MNTYNFLCKFDNKLKQLAIKNPHTTQIFCEVPKIELYKKDEDKKKQGYLYTRSFSGDLIKESNIKFKDSISNYFNNKIFFTLKNSSYKLNYQPRRQKASTTIHWGQLKLFLSTLQFLLYYAPKTKKVHIVYPGSACGINIYILTKMFPQCVWYLIDPSNFYPKLYNNSYIKHITNDFFTEKTAKYYKKLLKNKYVLFISDIRVDTDEKIIRLDNENQKKWVEILQPEYAQLKFRIPRDDHNYEYFDGKIFIQFYPPATSTETRLVVKKGAGMKVYNLEEYEDKLYYHNQVTRVYLYPHKHKLLKGMDYCYDCSGFYKLIKLYKKKYHNIENRSINSIMEYILKKLHGSDKLYNKTKDILDNIN